MIILLGTKGQVIKMAPVMKELNNDFLYVQTYQQPGIIKELESALCVKPPDLILWNSSVGLTSMMDVLKWWRVCLIEVCKHRNLFQQEDTMVTHSDTMSTLMACIVARLFKLKLVHIEAGLRSYSFMHPFPEEIIRRIVSRYADILITPSDKAYNNLKEMPGKVINGKQNTVYDTLCDLKYKKRTGDKYAVMAIHRQETIYNALRFMRAVETAHIIAENIKVKYILHESSKKKLKKYNFYQGLLQNDNIELLSYLNYSDFMNLVFNAEFVVTDGGGLQEETYYLNVPCLLLRDRTERQIGLNETAFLSGMDETKIQEFLDNYKKYKRKSAFKRYYPSKKIARYLLRI